MARMYDILRNATRQKIGVEIKKNNIYYFYDNEVLAKQTLTESISNKAEIWDGELYDGDDPIETLSGKKEDVADKCIAYSLKKKVEMDEAKRFGKQPKI